MATARIRLLEKEDVGAIACRPLSKPKKVEAAKRELIEKLRRFREP